MRRTDFRKKSTSPARGFYKLINRFKSDPRLRGEIALYTGALINFIFVGFELYGGIKYRSAWFIALAIYYLVLTVVKLYIGISARRKTAISQWKAFKWTGIVLMAINLALFVMISIMIVNPSITLQSYSKVVAIAIAIWTFHLFIVAIQGLLALRGKKDAWMLARGLVKLIGAIVAVLMLQTAITASFGTGGSQDFFGDAIEILDKAEEMVHLPARAESLIGDNTAAFLGNMNRLTGIAVGLIVLGLTIYMIVRGVREEKRLMRRQVSSGQASLGGNSSGKAKRSVKN